MNKTEPMSEEKITIYELEGGEVDILNAETDNVKLTKSGIFLCKDGEVKLTIDEKEYHLYPSSIVVYFSYSTLHINWHSKNLRGTLIGVDFETIQPMLYNVADFNALYTIKQIPHQILPAAQAAIINDYISLLKTAIQKEREETGHKEQPSASPIAGICSKQVELLSYALTLEILQCYAKAFAQSKTFSRKDDILQRFITKLYQQYRTEHQVTYYSGLQCLATRYFSTVIKEKSGKTPSQWITTALLVDARNLLKATTLSIHDISDTLNFPNQSYFGKWFKHLTGLSPLDYRNGKTGKTNEDKNFTDIIQRGLEQATSL